MRMWWRLAKVSRDFSQYEVRRTAFQSQQGHGSFAIALLPEGSLSGFQGGANPDIVSLEPSRFSEGGQ